MQHHPLWLERWAALLVHVFYPASFRRRHGGDLHRVYLQVYAATPRWRRLLVLLQLSVDAVWHGLAARLEAWKEREPGGPDLSVWRQDLHLALRMLARAPGFTAVAVLALGLGIGANVAVFSVVSGVYFHSLPYVAPQRLMMLWEDQSARGGTQRAGVSPANFLDWRQRSRSFVGLAALRNESRRLTGLGAEPRVPLTHRVTPNYFELLGATPLLGRSFEPEDGDERTTVMISHALWQGPLGGDPEIVGRSLELSGETFTIIGVVRSDFYSHHRFLTQPDLWLVSDFEDERLERGDRRLIVFARLPSEERRSAAQAEMTAIAEQLAAEHPKTNADWSVLVEPLRENAVGSLRQTFGLLLAAVALVLLISCANVANMILARAARPRREVALRPALGAGRWRIARQLLTESLVLALLGGGAGVALATLLAPAISSLIPQGAGVPFVDSIAVDAPVLLFSLAVSVASGLLFGLAPARQWGRASLAPALRDGDRGSGGGRRSSRQGQILIAAEVALAVVVAIAAGLMVQSFLQLRSFDVGFDPERLFTYRTSVRGFADPARRIQHYRELEDKLAAVAGIERVGSISFLPPLNPNFVTRFTSSAIGEVAGDEARAMPRGVTAGYFETMGIRLHRGRLFDRRDQPDSAPVVLVNAALVRRYFEDLDPVGQTLTLTSDARGELGPGIERTVIGVVGNVLTGGANPEPQPALYLPHTQAPFAIMNVVMRTSVEPLSVAQRAERVFWSMPGDLNVYGLQTLEQAVADTQWHTSFSTLLLSCFAVLALLLGAAGIFAVVSHSVAQRVAEIGVRVTFGARARDVVTMMLAASLRPTLIGIAVGISAAVAVTRLLQGLLFGVTATDPATFLVVAGALALTAVVASSVPAWRATRVDPAVALRAE